MIVIDLDEVVEKADALVAEVPENYVYDNPYGGTVCLYVCEDKPSCIVGKILSEIGISTDLLRKMDNEGAIWVSAHFLSKEGFVLSDNATHFLHEIQWRQDEGETWRHAVECGKRACGLISDK